MILHRALAVLPLLGLTHHEFAWAQEGEAAVSYYGEAQEPLVSRVVSELSSDGYAVRLAALASEPGCAASAQPPGSLPANTQRVRIILGKPAEAPGIGCAVIFHAGPASGWRQTLVTASTADVKAFAITVAEALNGLAAQALPVEMAGDVNQEIPPDPVGTHAPLAPARRVALGASVALMIDLTLREPVLAVGALGEWPVNPTLSLQLDGLWTATSLKLEEGQTELMARFVWTRLSLAVQVVSQPLSLKLTAGAGPAITWVTARVPSPDVARADVGTSAVFTLGSTLFYPSDALLQVGALVRASTLVPSLRFQLPSGPSSPFGGFVGEAGAVLRANW